VAVTEWTLLVQLWTNCETVGVPGVPYGVPVTEVEGVEPRELVAVTLQPYAVPLVRPVTETVPPLMVAVPALVVVLATVHEAA
jgi:hypothetical protein